MISFRLTPEEHDRFRALCSTHGLPSISEMARAAINLMFAEPVHRRSVESRLTDLEDRVCSLTVQLQKLAREPLPRSNQPRPSPAD
jgi:hypothetical protein